MTKIIVLMLLVLSVSLGGCGYNDLQSNDEQIKASWSEVVKHYQPGTWGKFTLRLKPHWLPSG